MVIGTNKFGARVREVKSTIGPSAPPMMDTAAASPLDKPSNLAIGKVATVPSSAHIAINIPIKGCASTIPISQITPIPMNTRQAIKPLLKVRV